MVGAMRTRGAGIEKAGVFGLKKVEIGHSELFFSQ